MKSSRLYGTRYDARFRRMLGFSALFHFIFLTFMIFSTNLPAPKLTFGPVYSVQLVSVSDQLLRGTSASSFSREILKPQPIPSTIMLRKPVETDLAVPLKKQEIVKKRDSNVEKALDELRNKVQTASKPVPATSHPATQAENSQADQGSQSDVGQRLNAYYAEIWAKVRGQWSMPQGILPQGNVETVINAKILRNGTVVDVSYEKKSGNRYFDDSAMRALKKASPLPPLPLWVRGNSIEIGIRFHSAEFR